MITVEKLVTWLASSALPACSLSEHEHAPSWSVEQGDAASWREINASMPPTEATYSTHDANW